MSKQNRVKARERRWQPMARSTPYAHPEKRAAMVAELTARGATADDITRLLAPEEQWANDQYVVFVTRAAPNDDDPGGWVTRLSIRRQDRAPARDWRHLQQIKNEICGVDVEAVELYPAEDRLVDTANQYWLWCMRPGTRCPVGWHDGRMVAGAAEAENVGAVQRELGVM